MKSGIFRRFFIANIGIILFVLVLLAVAVTFFVDNYSYEQKQSQLLLQGEEISRMAASYLNGDTTRDDLTMVIDAVAGSSGTRIMVLKARPDALRTLQEQFGNNGEDDLAGLYEKVLDGQKVAVRRQKATRIDLEVTMVGLPVYSGGRVGAVVFLYAPVEELRTRLRGFYYIIWGCAGLAMLLAAIIVFLVSRRMSRPLVAMAGGARKLAQGETIPDYEVKGKDELADLAAAMNHMQHELVRTEEVRQELITNVSHELRTPLTTIGGFIRAILDGVVPREQERHYLELADSEMQRLIRLVRDLLDLSRLKAGTARMNFSILDINAAAVKALGVMAMAASEAEVTLGRHASQQMLVWGDEDRLIEVVINLLQNALDYTPAGGDVWLSVEAVDGDAVLEVTDNGPGISAEDLPRIFDRFHRGEGSRKTGTGVGLAIVREIVERHSGHVEANSTEGFGTTVTVRIPLFTNGLQSGQEDEIDGL